MSVPVTARDENLFGNYPKLPIDGRLLVLSLFLHLEEIRPHIPYS
jgi:hypothetical protein